MDRNKLLQIKEYNNKSIEIIDDLLLITKNKGVKKITQSIDSNVGSNILEKYNKEGYSEVIPPDEKYKIVETIKKAEKAGNWSLVATLAGLLFSLKAPTADSKKHQPSIKPLEMQYTSTAGEHNDKYNEQVFNDATIDNLTINEVLEEPPIKPLLEDLKAQKNKLKRVNKPLMFDADLKAQKNKLKRVNKPLLFDADLIAQKYKLKPAVVKPLLFEADLKAQKRRLKKLNIDEDVKNELLDMIKTLKNTNIEEIDKTKEKEINKKIKKIEKFINKLELEPEPEIKPKARGRTKVNKDNGMTEMMREANKFYKEAKEAEAKKKEKKTKTVYDPKKIEKNKQLINDYTFNEKMSERFLTDGAKELFILKKNGANDEDVSQFSIVYLQKEPNAEELEDLRTIFKIKKK
jgi:hypothetical protein